MNETICKITSTEEIKIIEDSLDMYSASQCEMPFEEAFEIIGRCIKEGGEIKGGIVTELELKVGIHIRTFWLDESVRGKNLGTKLLREVEEEGKEKGATFAYLETFDFQAKDFYEKNGYGIFATLDYPTGNTMYFMKKQF